MTKAAIAQEGRSGMSRRQVIKIGGSLFSARATGRHRVIIVA